MGNPFDLSPVEIVIIVSVAVLLIGARVPSMFRCSNCGRWLFEPPRRWLFGPPFTRPRSRCSFILTRRRILAETVKEPSAWTRLSRFKPCRSPRRSYSASQGWAGSPEQFGGGSDDYAAVASSLATARPLLPGSDVLANADDVRTLLIKPPSVVRRTLPRSGDKCPSSQSFSRTPRKRPNYGTDAHVKNLSI